MRFVKLTTPGTIVRDPRTMQPLAPEGAFVPDHDPYWTRRLLDGDIVEATPPPSPEADGASRSRERGGK